eukprot:GHVU01215580.1.p1 GENE.GHVU01215580.1~~GHVU01215580.1.p1  ORF type:complete len:156 (+),score=20.81 GHVU01215580.1:2217-2684(+)
MTGPTAATTLKLGALLSLCIACIYTLGKLGVTLVLICLIALHVSIRSEDAPTGEGSGGERHSAYSVFNEGCRALLGDIRPEQIDGELRSGGRGGGSASPGAAATKWVQLPKDDSDDSFEGDRELAKPRLGNKACRCGSGKKTKKCCGAPESAKRK